MQNSTVVFQLNFSNNISFCASISRPKAKPRTVSCYIMRTLTTVLSLLITAISFGQHCSCEKDTMLAEIITCDTTKFDNKANLFWSFNCDSSWLTFENKAGQSNIILSFGDGLQNLTGRLGYIYLHENKNSFLIQNNVISGCCSA